MADMEFAVAKRRKDPITFSLGDDEHTYTFNPPKAALMLMPILAPEEGANEGMGMTKATFDWLGSGLSEEDNAHILARLNDDGDDLDVDTLSEVIQKLAEKAASGRPTT